MSSSFGRLFVVTTFGESHGAGVGVVVDGMPPGIPIDPALVQRELDRRRPGQSALTTQRKEADQAEILGGRMVLAVDDASGEPLLRGRIERLMDTPDRAATTLLTVLALGFALLSVVVVTTQRKAEPLG